jgi:predicted ATPase/signal transduction histidine kinase
VVESLQLLAYRSPEQTGRLKRQVDERSDLYSLGVVLYEMAMGALPFNASDPLEWAHRHLAVPPRPPRELDPAVPEMVERVLLRLLAKDPNERYQTASGLEYDLRRCLEFWQGERAIPPFALGERDRPAHLSIPDKVYGRELERDALLNAFELVRCQAGPRVVLIAGRPGVGKSTLVRELAEPTATAGAYLVAGKFEDAPAGALYGPVADGFGELITLILGGGDAAVADWRERLRSAVGSGARVLVDALPQLEHVLGTVPAAEPLPPAEAHYRFAGAFRRFAGVFATAAHPLVLVLDDLQWADAASLRLIGDLATDRSLRSLLVVLTYRDEEAGAGELGGLLGELRSAEIPIETIKLAPLAPEPLLSLLADAIGMPSSECAPLHAPLYARSEGNPLFFIQLLMDLRRSGLLWFDREQFKWFWDQEAIERRAAGDDVIELLTQRLGECSGELQRLLSVAACLGGSFDVRLLSIASSSDRTRAGAMIGSAVEAGLLSRINEGYRFSHDRVREVAYAAIPGDSRSATHVRIGRALLDAGADLREAVAQLDRGRSAIELPDERRELAKLNLVAAESARRAAAFDALSAYCAAGLELLGADAWTSDRELAFELILGGADAELFAGHLEEAALLLSEAVAHAASRHERARCARAMIDLKTATGEVIDGVEFALGVLREYGLPLSSRPEDAEAVARGVEDRLARMSDAALLGLERGEDSELDAVLELLARTGPQAALIHAAMFRLLVDTALQLTLDHGAYPASAWALSAYAYTRTLVEDYPGAARFGQIALQLVERHGFDRHRGGVCLLLAVNVWAQPIAAAIEFARQGAQVAIEDGEIHNASITSVMLCIDRLFAGAPLAEIERDADDGLEVARRVHLAGEAGNLVLIRQLVRALRGCTDRLSEVTDREFDRAALERTLDENEPVGLRWWYETYRLQLHVFAGEFAAALRARDRFMAANHYIQLGPLVTEVAFFSALAIAGSEPEIRAGELDRLREGAAQLARWARSCPENFAARAALVSGELERVEGHPTAALESFSLAVARAQQAGFVQIEALAHESAARLCRELGRDRQAERHVRAAVDCYREWGAAGKAQLLGWAAAPLSSHAEAAAPDIDALAVARAAQAISEEVEHVRVLERLLETAIMQAGARGGQLLLAQGGEIVVAATAERSGSGVAVTLHEPPVSVSVELVAASVVNYVSRTRQPLVLGDARARQPFADDPYVIRRHVRSILCVPMLGRGELHGLLCVDNDLIPDVFTTERLAALEVIAAQAVISLENAQATERLRAVADERSRLHRVAELVARSAEPQTVFDAVCKETAELLGAPIVDLQQFAEDDVCVTLAGWSTRGQQLALGSRYRYGPQTLAGRVRATGAPARISGYEHADSDPAIPESERGIRSAVGAPIVINNRIWGILRAATDLPTPLPFGTEQQLVRLTDLIATSISNADARSALVASRARIVAAGDEARRRIERNLHDGAQQQLAVLGLELKALAASLPADAARARAKLERIRADTASVLEQIQQISRGLHPAMLSHGGLPVALQGLARRSPIPVDLTIARVGRLPEPIEICVYYVVSECLANAAKHSGAEHIRVSLALHDDLLQLRVDDDGRGGADTRSGTGLIGLTDRVEALGGSVTFISHPGQGTQVEIELPIPGLVEPQADGARE